MKMPKIKFPYGLSNMEQVATEGYVFVDKTVFLPKLEEDEKFVSFLRPRRIGKSLFVSMLEYYYDVKTKHKFNNIFGKYYIGQNPTPLSNAFHVLKMDFSGIDTNTKENSYSGFLRKVKVYIEKFTVRYPDLLSEQQLERILIETTPAGVMRYFFSIVEELNISIYLIIDEYDHFTNEILLRDLQEFKMSVSQNGYVRKFYEVVKEATQQGVINRFFITGVSPVTLDSLTSGFNIVKHLSHSEDFHDMIGFTEEEVKSLLDMVLEDKSRMEQIISDMRQYYNGYKFHPQAPHTIYNSDMALYFLDYFKRSQSYPSQILDPNIMPDYGKLKKMFEVANWQDNLEVLDMVLRDGEISSPQIFQFSFELGFGRTEFINFLYYMGNLTLKGEDDYGMPSFKIPNFVIGELYWKYYAHILQERAQYAHGRDMVLPTIYELLRGNEKPFFALIQQSLEILSNRDFQRFDEKYVKMLIIAYAMQGDIFHIISERETSKGGYVDVEISIRPSNTKKHAQYVFEVKYVKKEEAHLFDKELKEGEIQLRKYLDTDEILMAKEQLRAFVVMVLKDQVTLVEVK